MMVDNLAGSKITASTILLSISSGFGTMFEWIKDGGLTAILAAILTTVVIIANLIKIRRDTRLGELRIQQAEMELRIQRAKEQTRVEEAYFRRRKNDIKPNAP